MTFKGKVTLDKKTLEKLQRELDKAPKNRVHLGVLQNKVSRGKKAEFNNADIGAVHELGSKSGGIPRRSFLVEPCKEHLSTAVGEISAKRFVNVILKGGLLKALKMLGVVGEQVVDKAFETRGYGKWPSNSPATVAHKGSDSPLIDTGKLRRSITSAVVPQ